VSGLPFWECRARTYGARAVLNLKHASEEIEAVTQVQLDAIMPRLRPLLRGDECVALDFGCGTGRFTKHLAELIAGRAIGVDPIKTLLDLAPVAHNVEYRLGSGRKIPVADSSVDLLWICLVLGGLTDRELAKATREIDRVMRPGALLFVVENTAIGEKCNHWVFRSVAEYQRALYCADLRHLGDYDDLGQRNSILAGRKRSHGRVRSGASEAGSSQACANAWQVVKVRGNR
jgi:SAM-dependent methyltransferase